MRDDRAQKRRLAAYKGRSGGSPLTKVEAAASRFSRWNRYSITESGEPPLLLAENQKAASRRFYFKDQGKFAYVRSDRE